MSQQIPICKASRMGALEYLKEQTIPAMQAHAKGIRNVYTRLENVKTNLSNLPIFSETVIQDQALDSLLAVEFPWCPEAKYFLKGLETQANGNLTGLAYESFEFALKILTGLKLYTNPRGKGINNLLEKRNTLRKSSSVLEKYTLDFTLADDNFTFTDAVAAAGNTARETGKKDRGIEAVQRVIIFLDYAHTRINEPGFNEHFQEITEAISRTAKDTKDPRQVLDLVEHYCTELKATGIKNRIRFIPTEEETKQMVEMMGQQTKI